MRTIRTQAELKALAAELDVRRDWHEPDEVEVDAVTKGNRFDNAGFWPDGIDVGARTITEKHVIIRKSGKPVAAVNLASLFAMACGNSMER